MNNVHKFTSLDKFKYEEWIKEMAKNCLTESKNILSRKHIEITDAEIPTLINHLINVKGMTLHFYYSGRITEHDLRKLRPEVKKEEQDKTKCPRCTTLLTAKSAGKVRNGHCESCADILKI